MNIPNPIRALDTLTAEEACRLAPQLVAFLNDALRFAQVELDGPPHLDLPVSGADTLDWLCGFREDARALLGDLAAPPIPAAEYEAEYGPA